MKGLTVNLNPSSFEGHDNQHRPDDPEILVDFKGVALESLPVISPLPIFFTTFPFFETNLEHWSGTDIHTICIRYHFWISF